MAQHSDTTCSIREDQGTRDATAIFFATVKSESGNNAFLDVERVWKGEVPKETWTWTSSLKDGGEGPDDDIVETSYLIYGTPNGSVDGFFAFPCVSQQSTLEGAISLLGAGNEPHDFVATLDEPFPIIDGSPLGITSNGYVVAAFCSVFIVGAVTGALGTKLFRKNN